MSHEVEFYVRIAAGWEMTLSQSFFPSFFQGSTYLVYVSRVQEWPNAPCADGVLIDLFVPPPPMRHNIMELLSIAVLDAMF